MEYSAKKIERFKWPVSVSRKIAASADHIWRTMATPGIVSDYHPFCKKNPAYKWPGVGAKDGISYYSGWVLQREFINWVDGMGYDLMIGRKDGRKSYVSWRITEEQDNTGVLRITIYPHALQNIPVAIRWIPHITTVQPALHNYLDAVLKGFEWYITTGKPVMKDQFGSHKWFSN